MKGPAGFFYHIYGLDFQAEKCWKSPQTHRPALPLKSCEPGIIPIFKMCDFEWIPDPPRMLHVGNHSLRMNYCSANNGYLYTFHVQRRKPVSGIWLGIWGSDVRSRSLVSTLSGNGLVMLWAPTNPSDGSSRSRKEMAGRERPATKERPSETA